MAPTFGFIGTHHIPEFGVVNMELDKKDLPNVDIVIKVLDEATKKQVGEPIVNTFPLDLPAGLNLKAENFVHWRGFPIYLSRTGRFIIDITVTDKLGKTAPVTLKATQFNCYDSPMLKREVCGGDFETTIDRTQWGMNYGVEWGFPKNVRLVVQIEAVKQ